MGLRFICNKLPGHLQTTLRNKVLSTLQFKIQVENVSTNPTTS